MASFAHPCLSLLAALLLALPAASAQNAQPTINGAGNIVVDANQGEAADLDVSIAFTTTPVLMTTVVDGGTIFGSGSPDPNYQYPPLYFGTFPGYVFGTKLEYDVTIRNTSKHAITQLDLTAASFVLEHDGSDGKPIGDPQDPHAWSIDSIAPGETITIHGFVIITGDHLPVGLDVTHISLYHHNNGDATAGIIKVCTGVWCPPPVATSANG